MCQDIINGIDPHGSTAVELMELELTKDNRQSAKTFNFRIIFADEHSAAYAFFMDYRMPRFSQKKWDKIVESFYQKYAGFSKAHQAWVREVQKTGQLRGPTGRVWVFDKYAKRGGYKDYNKAQIYNYKVQGTAGDIMKLAGVYVRKRIKHLPILLTNTVHDSLILDARTEEAAHEGGRICFETFNELPDLVYKHFKWRMPVPITGEIEVGSNWKDIKQLVF